MLALVARLPAARAASLAASATSLSPRPARPAAPAAPLAGSHLRRALRREKPAHAPLSRCRCAAMSTSTEPETHKFGPYTIRDSEVFLHTPLSLALVNLKPVVPGHVLIIPRRVAVRNQDLTPEELTDLWSTAQRVGTALEGHYKAESLTLTVQDGPAAGQTVPHVHIHVLPRRYGDFEPNDKVYDEIDGASAEAKAEMERRGGGEKLDLDANRVVRTLDQMAEEANELRALF